MPGDRLGHATQRAEIGAFDVELDQVKLLQVGDAVAEVQRRCLHRPGVAVDDASGSAVDAPVRVIQVEPGSLIPGGDVNYVHVADVVELDVRPQRGGRGRVR